MNPSIPIPQLQQLSVLCSLVSSFAPHLTGVFKSKYWACAFSHKIILNMYLAGKGILFEHNHSIICPQLNGDDS